jgi:hypothetical protein
VFICDKCELTDEPFLSSSAQPFLSSSAHHLDHPLLRYKVIVTEDGKTVESRLIAMETRFRDFEQSFGDRLSAIEELLKSAARGQSS